MFEKAVAISTTFDGIDLNISDEFRAMIEDEVEVCIQVKQEGSQNQCQTPTYLLLSDNLQYCSISKV